MTKPAVTVADNGFADCLHRWQNDIEVALAARLPEGAGHVLNLCRDRYAFMVTFAAVLIRGRVGLLCGDPSPAVLAALLDQHADTVAVSDDEAITAPCPTLRADPTGQV